MNPHPVHLNVEYASKARHGRILVVGTLVFSLAVGLTVPEISYNAIANLGYWDVLHLAPVFIGDTIRVESELIERVGKSEGKEIRTYTSTVYNQNDIPVLSFRRKILI
jgi:acyl dehydratase